MVASPPLSRPSDDDLPPAPPRPWRLSARLLVADPESRVLLVPVDDGEASWWDLPGGGLEPGESTAQAAVRETLEETGYAVPLSDVGPVCWSGDVVFRWLGRWTWSRQVVHRARVAYTGVAAAVAFTDLEAATHGAARWWGLAEAEEQGLSIPPFGNTEELAALLAGGTVRDAWVRWPPRAGVPTR